MVSSTLHASARSQPASYEHMEQALSVAISKPGENTQELTGGPSDSMEEAPAGVGKNPHKNGAMPASKSPQHESDTQKVANPLLSNTDVAAQSQEGESSDPNEVPANACFSAPGAPQTGSYGNDIATSNPPASDGSEKKTELRPLAPSPVALGPGFESAPPTISLDHLSSFQEVSKATIASGQSRLNEARETKSPSASPTSCSPTNIHGSKPKAGSTLRRGKWTVEEETYVARVIQDFNSGFLNAPAGTTLRSYLSDKLQCDPMRITKKFTGDACIGKRVFHPAVRNLANISAIDKAQAELDTLEKRWRRRLEMQQRESAKKAAASVAAANAATAGSRGHTMIQGVPVALLSGVGQSTSSDTPQIGQSVVTQAASWLDRANAILKGGHMQSFPIATTVMGSVEQTAGETIDSMPNSEIENQMKEVQRLIYEGPHIQQTTAGLPNLFHSNQSASDGVFDDPPSPPEPADKRMRTGGTISGAEDAEALVGFLRSVRASAAGGQDTS